MTIPPAFFRWNGMGAVVLIFGLPLVGVWLTGRSMAGLFTFPPPLDIPVNYLRFSWAAAGVVIVVLAATLLPWWYECRTARARTEVAEDNVKPRGSRFRAWGVAAVVWTAGWWALAWARWPAFETWQRYTFFPLWLGFVVMLNGLIDARVGTCLMRRHPTRWLALFGASALCWWGFEWLNRFVRNWHYLGVEDHRAVGYAVHATLCFSTVLPAVAAIAEWLDSHLSWRRFVSEGPRWRWFAGPRTRLLLVVCGAVALVGAGALPEWFYPALWVAPLALLLAAAGPAGGRELTREIAAGDWRRAATWMIASLLCGFFWEMWNWLSFAKWIYTVPGVERWYVFEMPLLGYAGYLPFGLECLLVAEYVIGREWQSPMIFTLPTRDSVDQGTCIRPDS